MKSNESFTQQKDRPQMIGKQIEPSQNVAWTKNNTNQKF